MSPETGAPSAKTAPDPDLFAPKPKVAGLNRRIVIGVIALVAAAGIGAVAWDYNRGAEAEPATSMMVGTGRAGLETGYKPVEAKTAPTVQPPAKEPPRKVVEERQRSRRVLWGRDGAGNGESQLADPNLKIAEAAIAAWLAEAGVSEATPASTHDELPGCVVKGGTMIEAMQRGGVLQIMRPVIGYDQRRGTCVAIRAGATLGLQEHEDGGFCATRLDQVGGGIRRLACWALTGIEGRDPRSAIYKVRTDHDISFEG
jgi:hypothetical protein